MLSMKGPGAHPVEAYDARERESKAKWHYDRAGKQRGASLSKGVHHDYEAQLLRRGVKDSNGEQTPLNRSKFQDPDKASPDSTRILHGFAFRE